MKKTLTFVVAVIILSFPAISQNPYEIVKIKIDMEKFVSQYKSYTTEFYTSKKKKIGKFLCFDLVDIIDNNIKQLAATERKKLVIVAETSTGESIPSTYFDYDKDFRRITPMLIFGEVKGIVGDTAVIEDFGGAQSKLNIKAVDKELLKVVERRVYLQIKSISENDIDRIFRNKSIIFPEDQNSERWLTDIINLRLYLLK